MKIVRLSILKGNDRVVTPRFAVVVFWILALIGVGNKGLAAPLPIPTLGTYPNTTIVAGSNAVITPSAAPSGAVQTYAVANPKFTGTFVVNPTTGELKVINAKQAGVFTVTVKALDAGGIVGSTTFTLTVTNPDCSPGTFSAPTSVTAGSDPNGAAIGDFNEDGKQDLAVTNNSSNNVSVRLGDGLGGFTAAANVAVGANPFAVAVGDFNGDGKQDLAVANNGANTISIKLGDGAGGFTGSTLLTTGNGPTQIAVGDFNEDGKQDLATGNYSSNNISIHLGDGTGAFVAGTTVAVGTQVMSVAVGDFNEDGHQDLATANRGTSDVSIRFGDGLGAFSGVLSFSVGFQPYHVALGDLDADGHQDLVTANYGSNDVTVIRGNGLGGFLAPSNFAAGANAICVAIGDFNGNGTQDLAVSNFTGNSVSILQGNGTGSFTSSSTIATGAMARFVVVGDFNADGHHDLANANFASSYVSIAMGIGNEINVKGNNVTIVDGDAIATTADHSDFGSVLTCSGAITRVFRIENNGNTNLVISGITISGVNASDFTVATMPTSPIVAGGFSNFQVTFDASATGSRNATINIANDDCDENPYDFAIQGTGNADIVNPTIGCPANVNTTTSSDGGNNCAAVVTGLGGSASDNCTFVVSYAYSGATSGSGSATVNQMLGTFAMGAISFNGGLTTVVCTATDAAANTTTCTFTVTVVDNEPPVLYNLSCQASTAAGTAYNDGWQSGDNDGAGFGAWTLTASTGNTTQAGFFVGDSRANGAGTDSNADGDINSSGRALGMYANSAQAAIAERSIVGSLVIGSRLVLEIDNGFVDNGQIIGFQLQNASGLSLGEVRFRGAQANYELVDALGITPFTSVPFTDEGLIIEVTPIALGQSQIKLTRKVNGATQTLVSNHFPGGGNQVIGRIKVFSSNAGLGSPKDLFVNNMQVCTATLGCPANISANNGPGLCGAVLSYNALSASDNCSTALPVTQISGLASGATFPIGLTNNIFRATDLSGNTATCAFTVTVSDNALPTAICRNLTVYLNSGGTANLVPAMLDNGSTDNCSITTRSLSATAMTCANLGANAITLTVGDGSGNTATCTGTVTVADSTHPTAICRNLTVYLNSGGTANLVPAMLDNGSTDNCSITTRSLSVTGMTCANLGANAVTLTVGDGSGNTATCTGTVTVADSTHPTAICRNLTVYLNSGGTANLVPAMLDNGSTDNCGITTRSLSATAMTCANLGANAVTLTVGDGSGNTATCTGTVTVADSTHPTAICRNLTVYLNSGGTANLVPAMLDNGSTDNCSITTRSLSATGMTCANLGANAITLTVGDGSGNTATCTGTVTVADSTHPTAICQPTQINIPLDASGQASILPSLVDNGSTDICGIASMTVSPNTFNCSSQGFPTLTLTVTDNAGNTATCTSTAIVYDGVGPVALCHDLTVLLDGSGNASIIPPMIDNGSSDECAIANLNVSPNVFNCPNVGPNVVTLTIFDTMGATAQCSAVVTVVDATPPTAICQNITVYLDGGGTVNVPYAAVDGGSTDACGISTFGPIAPVGYPFNCAQIGAHVVNHTVTDVNGNSSACSATITVLDSIHPTITCPASIAMVNDPGQCFTVPTYSVSAADNCLGGAVPVLVSGLASGANFPIGVTTDVYQITDLAGNTATCSFTVTVLDIELPSITCPADITLPAAPGQCSASATYVAPVGSDNCPGATTIRTVGIPSGGTVAAGTTQTNIFMVTDASGNTETCSFVITVIDTEVPTLVCGANVTVNAALGGCSAVVTYFQPIRSDNCIGSTTTLVSGLPSGASFPVGTTTIGFLTTDIGGNTATCSFDVIVNDNQLPTITCPAAISVNASVGACSQIVSYTAPTGADNCAGATTTQTAGLASGASFPVGVTSNTFRVTDAAGNSATCTFTVTVIDNIVPSITCPAAISVSAGVSACSQVVSYTAPTGADNCAGATTTQTAGLASGASFPVGVTSNTFRVTDAAGNSATCTFTVTVIDNIAPSITCPAAISVSASVSACSQVVSYTTPTGADNCAGATTTQTAGLASGASFPVGVTSNTFRVTDVAGNSATCTFTVTVVDNIAPTITCPAAISVSASVSACSQVVSYTTPTGADNCAGATTTQTAGLASGASFPVGVTSNTFRVMDNAGNTATCTFTVTVIDNIAPSITCPANTSANAGAGLCSAIVNYSAPTGADNCAGATTTQTAGLASGASFPVGVTSNTFRVTDNAGNTATCTFTVTVIDNIAPSINCPANTSANAGAGLCSAIVNYSAPTGADNCAGATTTQTAGLASGASFPVGVTSNTFRVTDNAGNTATCTFTVTVIDNIAPSITCPANTSANAGAGLCSAIVNYTAPTGADNCAGATTTQTAGLASGASFPVGVTSNTFRVTDNSGNSATCAFTVTVVDNIAPSITCPANTSANAGAGLCSAIVNYTAPTGADNCAGATTTQIAGLPSGASFPVGATSNTFRVMDNAGNTATCAFTVTVIDNIAPSITCPAAISVSASVSACSQVVSYTAPTGADNCAGATTTQTAGLASGASFPVGVTVNSFAVSDNAGNSASCTFSVTVVDNIGPLAICQGVTVNLDPSGNGSTTAAAIDNGSSDNCGIATVALSQTAFTCSNAGANTVTLTVTDIHGNTSTCNALVTVVPQAVTLAVLADTAQCGYNISCAGATDGTATASGGGGCPGYSYLWSNGQTTATATGLGVGTHSVTVTDAAGSTTVQTVTLSEPSALQATASITATCLGDSSGSIDLTASGGNDCLGYSYLWSNGLTTEDLNNLVAGTYSVTVSDAGGCSLTQTFTVSAWPLPVPTFTQAGNLLSATQVWSSYQWLLNGNNIPGANGSTYGITQTGTYALSVTDSNGCVGISDTSHVVGIAETPGTNLSLTLFPNPARDVFKLRTSMPIDAALTVRISDMYGKVVLAMNLRELLQQEVMDIRGLSAGTYLVEVQIADWGYRNIFRLVAQ